MLNYETSCSSHAYLHKPYRTNIYAKSSIIVSAIESWTGHEKCRGCTGFELMLHTLQFVMKNARLKNHQTIKIVKFNIKRKK